MTCEKEMIAPIAPDTSKVICPNCVHQFTAIPVLVQEELRSLAAENARLTGQISEAEAKAKHYDELADLQRFTRVRCENLEAALQRVATGTFTGPYANLSAEIAEFASTELAKWTAKYSYDKTDNHTRLFCAASDWMDRAERAEAELAAARGELEKLKK